jgi:hypothetical protein
MAGRSWREKAVRRVRNPEGGTDRVRQARELVGEVESTGLGTSLQGIPNQTG